MSIVSICSDLHLEMADLELPGGDILVLCGDVCEARKVKPQTYNIDTMNKNGKKINKHDEDRYYRFFQEECSKYNRTLYVCGNHEHYGYKLDKTHAYLKENLPPHVELLECDTVEIDNWLFVGTTLWTDLNDGDPLTEMIVKDCMNDFKCITKMDRYGDNCVNYRKLRPKDTSHLFYRSRDYINLIASNNMDKNLFVMTHHAPSPQSCDPMYISDKEMNGAFYSDLSELILDRPNIKVWSHGHIHHRQRHYVGDTLVVNNSRGYVGHESMTNSFNIKTIDLNNLPTQDEVFDDPEWKND